MACIRLLLVWLAAMNWIFFLAYSFLTTEAKNKTPSAYHCQPNRPLCNTVPQSRTKSFCRLMLPICLYYLRTNTLPSTQYAFFTVQKCVVNSSFIQFLAELFRKEIPQGLSSRRERSHPQEMVAVCPHPGLRENFFKGLTSAKQP